MVRFWIVSAAVNGFAAVALGAFGAHGLRERLEAHQRTGTWETAVVYEMFHALALLAVAWLASRDPAAATHAAGWCFLIGIVLFSGSLYALCLTNVRVLGAITPFGGVLFLAGWVLLAVAGLRFKM
jgi:uncharacterized membrane protein YgdD (TMEM256/DUF423 family)